MLLVYWKLGRQFLRYKSHRPKSQSYCVNHGRHEHGAWWKDRNVYYFTTMGRFKWNHTSLYLRKKLVSCGGSYLCFNGENGECVILKNNAPQGKSRRENCLQRENEVEFSCTRTSISLHPNFCYKKLTNK